MVDPEKLDRHEEDEFAITLRQRVTLSIRALDKGSALDPYKIASHAIKSLDTKLIRFAAHLQLRQITRELLRRTYEGKPSKKPSFHEPEAPTFEGDDFSKLQARYPCAHDIDGERGYVLLNDITEEDWRWNLDQLHNDWFPKSLHETILQRWGEKIKGFTR